MCIFLIGCDKQPFTGYVVGKEYTPKHRCHDGTKTVSYAIIHTHTHVTRHRHRDVAEKYEISVANKNTVRSFNVSKTTFSKSRLGKKITMK